jgi:signal transduction histidine kinase
MTKKPESNVPVGGRVLTIGQKTRINPVVLDLSRLAVCMLEELRRLLRADIRFEVSLLANGRCLVSADPHQMRDLILHLVLDARDAMPDGGSLSITVEKRRIGEVGGLYPESPGDYVTVTVRDSPGRPAAQGSEKMDLRVVKGRGLSLAASYDAIKRCGGHISVSRRACETFVRIFLPCLASSSAQAALGNASR